MRAELNRSTVSEVAQEYLDNDGGGVVGYDRKLNIRERADASSCMTERSASRSWIEIASERLDPSR